MTAAQAIGSAASAFCVLEQDKDAVTVFIHDFINLDLGNIYIYICLSAMD